MSQLSATNGRRLEIELLFEGGIGGGDEAVHVVVQAVAVVEVAVADEKHVCRRVGLRCLDSRRGRRGDRDGDERDRD